MGDIVKIGIIGDYDGRASHKATDEALRHCAEHLGMRIKADWLPTEQLEADAGGLDSFDGLWCAPGSPYRSMKGALCAIRCAREKDIPFIGTCAGFQHAVIEYAQDVLGMEVAHPEYDSGESSLFITPLSCSLIGQARDIFLKEGTMVRSVYGRERITERYNCSFGLNPEYQERMDASGFKTAGVDEAGEVRVAEIPQNRFFVASLFQPQLSSAPEHPHPLVCAYLRAAGEYHRSK